MNHLRQPVLLLSALLLPACSLLPQTEDKRGEDTHSAVDDTGGEDSGGGDSGVDLTEDDARVRALTDLPEGDQPCAEPLLVRIDYTVDGDTFYCQPDGGGANIKVRMIGMNTPEIAHDTAAECYSNEAWAYTAAQLEGRLAWLTYDVDCTDDYGRTLAYVIRDTAEADGFFNRNLLRHGFATTLTIYPDDTYEDLFADDEYTAQNANLGLWGECR